ncbi:hypothetical protein SERLA73DRAFT_183746 [Serpula lacrymans var. lacrymans S7.3]|uniref:Uncharacterized protein n=2 Tax=Serpula lacrymans var. lacrymans TaxID=341189 RepID=F8Q1S1_SERL3|nr:uncharacterized protein SERLADRAFT_471106 [Serpula lacrymans var. lacrymans S7.9]EGN97132.1 hypothetical protein SERLA73DRAFT_183746 [Serpula lacrymans var. lacrymans S7.3]EGO22741.1 hypothetical protein SERLADRAFT_471106 [Serpula lacrymans var. lacrymans S7.9]
MVFLERDVNRVTDITKLLMGCTMFTIIEVMSRFFDSAPQTWRAKLTFYETYYMPKVDGARWDILEVPGDEGTSMVIVVVPPWQFDYNEFCEFTREGVQGKESLELSPDATPHHACTILWALLWDLCAPGNTQYFVVTTYHHWAFGNFSKDCRVATVTEPIEAYVSNIDSTPSTIPTPNIIQMLMFWMGSSLGAGLPRDKWVLPTDDIADRLPAQLR